MNCFSRLSRKQPQASHGAVVSKSTTHALFLAGNTADTSSGDPLHFQRYVVWRVLEDRDFIASGVSAGICAFQQAPN